MDPEGGEEGSSPGQIFKVKDIMFLFWIKTFHLCNESSIALRYMIYKIKIDVFPRWNTLALNYNYNCYYTLNPRLHHFLSLLHSSLVSLSFTP